MAGQRGKRNWGPQVSPVCAGSGSGVVSWPGGWKSGLRAGRVAGGHQGPQTATSSPCAYGSFVHVWRDCMLALLLLFLERLLFRAVLGSWQIRVEGAGIAHVLLPPPTTKSSRLPPSPPRVGLSSPRTNLADVSSSLRRGHPWWWTLHGFAQDKRRASDRCHTE